MSAVHAEQAERNTENTPTEQEEPLRPFDLMNEFEEVLARIKSLILGVYVMRTDHEDQNAELYLLTMAEECCDGIKDVGHELYTAYSELNKALVKH